MSGGSWDYVYNRIEDVGMRLKTEDDPRRRALGTAFLRASKVLRAIEWNDSGDTGQDDEDAAWKEYGEGWERFDVAVLQESIERAEEALDELRSAIEVAKEHST